MVGARQGWIEAPYLRVPTPPLAEAGFQVAPTTDPRLSVHIVPGLMQSDPADVMRGEETQIAGFLASRPDFDGMLCLPGTHTKWVRVQGGAITQFRSHMTGELFALLAQQSVLKHSVAADELDMRVFRNTVNSVVKDSQAALTQLFAIRAADLLHGTPPSESRAHLSALLIGAEVAAAATGGEVVLLGDPALCELYSIALTEAGAKPVSVDAAEMTLAGLIAARSLLETL
ncbi:UNVERIFIED_CONTAM: hypothetical protein GTU68_005769 [Idotea baltica]|nr:hypothetical protein [Idotea baltica]